MQKQRKRKSDPEGEDRDGDLQDKPTCSSKIPRRSIPSKGTSPNGATEHEFDDPDHISDDEEGGVRVGDIYIPPAPKPALTMETTGPRLLITKIVNENFKSYYGVQDLGPFHKSFTAIVGPNGSGKSNVIDSMLFVFGYRATKIRSKKISVLLHKSSKHQEVDSATVSVHFVQILDKDGDDAYEEIPDSHIVVSRTAFKDNSSFYTLNGRKVQFKEVAKMLKFHGIDLDHNRFLILQGEVELIAMMKAKGQNENETGLLEYLEDIIGTSRFKEPLEKLVVRVDEFTEMRKEKLNRVRLVENEKQKLEQPMKEAIEQLTVANNLRRMKSTLLQKYIYETSKIINEKIEEATQLKNDLKVLDERLNSTQKKREEKQSFLKEHNQKYDKLKERKEKLTELNKTLRNRDGAIHSETNQANKRKKNVQNLLQTERGKLIELKQVPEKNRKEIAECDQLEQKLKHQKEELELKLQTVMETVRSETEGLQDAKDKLQARLIELKKTEGESNMKLKLAESELKIYMRNEVEDKEKLDRLTSTLQTSTTALADKKATIAEINTTLPNTERELSVTQRQLQSAREDEAKTVAMARSLRAQLEESKQTMTANNSKNRVLDFIMNQKKNGRLPGVYGRLGDLGGIDMKYDVAISTCCSALDNILVDTVDTAKTCIELLKKHNVGRATFIALEKQEHLRQQADRKITTPENVPRLFDLIKVTDARVRPAFYFALRDTLVAKDLEQATRIAYGRQRYRVVSLNGDLIEIAGTMSGGGKSVMRGRMGTSVRQDTSEATDPSVLAAQERKVEEMEARLPELRSMLVALEDKVTTLSRTVNDLRMEKSKLEIEVKHLGEQLPTLRLQLKEQEGKMKKSGVDPKQKAKLEQVIAGAMKVYEKAKSASGEIESQVKEIQSQIVAVSGGKLQSVQKSINDVTKNIEKIRTEVTKLNVAINASARNVKKSEDKIGHMETDIKEIEGKLAKLQEEKKTITIDAVKVDKELEEIEESINEDSGKFSGVKEEIGKLQKQETKLKSERLDLVNNISNVEKAITDRKASLPTWRKELSSLVIEDPNIQGVPKQAPLITHTDEELEAATVEDLRNKHNVLQDRLGDKQPNLNAIKEYKAKEELYLKRAEELEEITKQRNDMRELHDNLRRKRANEFMLGFSTITAKLKEMYQMITLGGDAELELVDSLDPFTEGIVFSVRPPNKSWKNISNLSGGEKTLSSLALVFALHYYKPSPLYVMDEIDAALDFKNVSIVANYIKERTRNAQFIIISLRYNMFEMANKLVGIYKPNDCTQSVALDNRMEHMRKEPKECREQRDRPVAEDREMDMFGALLVG